MAAEAANVVAASVVAEDSVFPGRSSGIRSVRSALPSRDTRMPGRKTRAGGDRHLKGSSHKGAWANGPTLPSGHKATAKGPTRAMANGLTLRSGRRTPVNEDILPTTHVRLIRGQCVRLFLERDERDTGRRLRAIWEHG